MVVFFLYSSFSFNILVLIVVELKLSRMRVSCCYLLRSIQIYDALFELWMPAKHVLFGSFDFLAHNPQYRTWASFSFVFFSSSRIKSRFVMSVFRNNNNKNNKKNYFWCVLFRNVWAFFCLYSIGIFNGMAHNQRFYICKEKKATTTTMTTTTQTEMSIPLPIDWWNSIWIEIKWSLLTTAFKNPLNCFACTWHTQTHTHTE